MSFRTMINDVQIFGNNQTYSEWLHFIQLNGIEIDQRLTTD